MTDSDLSLSFEAQENLNFAQSKLEGYKGFSSPEDRKASDEALCGYLADLLSDYQLLVASLAAHLTVAGDKALKARAVQAAQRLDATHGKVDSPPYGFSLFFTANFVPQEIQEKVLLCDCDILTAAAQIEQVIEPTLAPESPFADVLNKVDETVALIEEQVEERLSTIMSYN